MDGNIYVGVQTSRTWQLRVHAATERDTFHSITTLTKPATAVAAEDLRSNITHVLEFLEQASNVGWIGV